MKLFRFLLTVVLTLVFAILLNNKLGSLPPLGSLLSPMEGFYQNGEADNEAFTFEALTFETLNAPVSVSFDEFLVPHIAAENNQDAYFVQGYITARYRLWQMETQTRAAAGRLSEVLGSDLVDFDREIRRQGLGVGAANALASMEADSLTFNALTAYTAGVNAYISRLDKSHLPIEYKLLDYRPEPWSLLKSALLLKFMARDLTGRDNDLENTHLKNALGSTLFNKLFPDRLPNEDPVIPKGTRFTFKPLNLTIPATPVDSLPFGAKELEKPDRDNGSNNWAVAGSKTKSGSPILANDPHLGLSLPSLWYIVQISTPTQNVYGVSLPGAPGVILGFNEHIAWGATNAMRDVRDWYKIEFQDKSRKKYRYENQWLEVQTRIEKIKQRAPYFWQNDEIFVDSVAYTHFGPVVYDATFQPEAGNNGYALRWTAHDPSNELRSFLLLNQAENYTDFLQALSTYKTPAQNFAFASVSDTIAMQVQGSYPARWKDQGKFLLEGSDALYEWQGYIPTAQNAHVVNPERGFVSSANQIPVAADYPYYVYDPFYEHYRNRRINQRLSKMRNITPEDMMNLQLDNYDLHAAETLPRMLSLVQQENKEGSALAVYNLLSRWDYQRLARSEAAALYQQWWKLLNDTWWDELDSLKAAHDRPSLSTVAYLLVNDSLPPLTDIQSTSKRENLQDILLSSFNQLVDWRERWEEENGRPPQWEDLKNSRILHLLRLAPFSLAEMEVDGAAGTINANKGTHGPSWRMVVEMGKPVKAWGIYPGGQSGNPGSPYYVNQVEKWRLGQFNRLYFRTAATPFDDKMLETITFSR